MTDLKRLRGVRWAVRAALALGLLTSVAGNVLHANDNGISQTISAWPVLALYVTIELISRVPIHRRALAAARMLAAAVIAGIAAWVSYWHMAGVAARYGEQGSSPYLLPLSVDGLIVVASICLVELGGRIADAETEGVSDGQELLPAASGDAPGLGEPREGRPAAAAAGVAGEGVREVGAAAEGAGEPLTAGVKLTPVRKKPPTAAAAVARAHRKYPHESNREIADRLKLSPVTVKRHRPKTEQINGNVPALAGAEEKEN